MLTKEKFQTFIDQGYNRIPLIKEIQTDLETPLSIYLKLADEPYTFLFESVQGGEKWGRYSFIGLAATQIIKIKNHHLTLTSQNKIVEEKNIDDPLEWIADYQKQFCVPPLTEFKMFNGGLVGYFSYDTIRYIEPKLAKNYLPDPIENPDILLMVCDQLIIFDTLLNKSFLIIYANASEENAYEKGQNHLSEISKKIEEMSLVSRKSSTSHIKEEFSSNFEKGEFKNCIQKAVEYIEAGEAMQIVLSQRLSIPYSEKPFNFYRALRSINPSPYLFYLNLNEFFIIGSSPEILVRLEEKQVTVRPIAGTRHRGNNETEDLDLEKELLADPKELAEHLMLIDLGRNDIGRVCKTGTVKVTEKMLIERYSHVMHIVSNVTGELKDNLSAVDVIRATFPAGTLTGAPKVRAMEIIDELENVKRGVYGGAVGYWAWNGNMDLAIAIRTAVIKNQILYVQAGAGVVADSIPENEWQETLNKANALIKAAKKI